MKRVSLFMDVEDPINPRADDAALEFSELFRAAGVRGNFCITGAKCRTLVDRGRLDVLRSLCQHCLGLHTDTHSEHPTTMEMLGPLDYEAGCKAATATESRGASSFKEAFGMRPAFWGGAGNTWSPEICAALTDLRIPAYSYALTQTGGIHRFAGVIGLPQHVSVGEDNLMQSSWNAESALRQIEAVASDWVGIFVGHPTRFRYRQFWDYGYAEGRTPETPCLAEVTPNSDYVRAKSNLTVLVEVIASRYPVIGVDELLALPRLERALDDRERADFKTRTTDSIRQAANWPIHTAEMDVENIIHKTLALTDSVRIVELEGQ